MKSILLVNFGGPRNTEEIFPFLQSLLTDQDVIDTALPAWLHSFIFSKIAKKRAQRIQHQYHAMGGFSPIYQDTEVVAQSLSAHIKMPVLTFHRYLPTTHEESCRLIEASEAEKILVFPMFPQFTFTTTGSIARFFLKKLSQKTLQKMQWIRSYANHESFIQLFKTHIMEYVEQQQLNLHELFFLFSAHGIPQSYADRGDPYPQECMSSMKELMQHFPQVEAVLAYQSRFGKATWLQPYTIDVCEQIHHYCKDRKKVLCIPLSFTSDHLETLVEIEEEYMPVLREQGIEAYRVPAFNRSTAWIETISHLLSDFTPCSTSMLVKSRR